MTPEDRAQKHELDEYVLNQARGILPEPTEPSAKYCADPTCGAEIPEKRRQAWPGVQFCAECKARHEQQQSRRR